MKRGTRDEEAELRTIYGAILFDIWGGLRGEFVYDGCDVPLMDGRECALGVHARRQWETDSLFPRGEHSRQRDLHHCRLIGEGKYMFHFYVQVEGEVLTVWEKTGAQLFGMSGQDFFENFKQEEQRRTLCN
ncbi:unnamed protein product [Calypogeia fissa]